MFSAIRLCLPVLLSLALALLSVTAGAGHAGPMPGQTQMVICSGDSTKTITLDASGNLVDPAHCDRQDCPDCLQPYAVAVPDVGTNPAAATGRSVSIPARPVIILAHEVASAAARGPPSEA